VQLERYQARTVRVNRRRLYQINGHTYPGVTTVLSATKPAAARKALYEWRQRVGAKTAQAISNQASSAGTRLHKRIADFLQGKSVEIPPDVTGYWESLRPILDEIETTWLVEGAVWHDAGYIGFPDALVTYQGALYVCDWKTALKPKQLDWIGDYCLQVSAYAQAIEQVYATSGIEIAGALIAIALADAPAQTFWLTPDDLTHHWHHFQTRLAEYYQLRPVLDR